MTSPVSHIASRVIGTVESVSPDEIKVLLDVDSPRSTALNAGVPTPFPRINSFVLLPNESGGVVGMVIWLGVERSPYPKRQGLKDFGLIDLPFPLRKMTVSPIGTLFNDKNLWRLERGVQSFPSVGETVILPTPEQTVAIVTGIGPDSRLKLGICPSAHGAEIRVNPDKLFGRHLAILGNTGSGKSCTVASLIRTAVKTAQEAIKKNENEVNGGKENTESQGIPLPNARFIILDPNGEYSKCFQDLGTECRIFQVPPLSNNKAGEFILPAWMWNSSEWAAVSQAAPRVQKPILQTAIRDLRAGNCGKLDLNARIWGRCSMVQFYLSKFDGKGTQGWPDTEECGNQLMAFQTDISAYSKKLDSANALLETLNILKAELATVIQANRVNNKFRDFSDLDLANIRRKISTVLESYPSNARHAGASEDWPVEFPVDLLADYLARVANEQGGNSNQFIATMVMRIRAILSDTRMRGVVLPEQHMTLKDWLENHIGSNCGANGAIAVIDLSLIPYEILHLVIAVSSRLIIEALQRYHKVTGTNLPTVLVLEEAHTFVSKRLPHGDDIPSPADMCRTSFERIAREGRKFGLGLVLSSQRPSELSETVLSQCNSFLLHRITNDRDQELVTRLVPDTARGLLRELPSLPTRLCILLGIATKVPILIEVEDLSKEHRPESDDPDFWSVWTNEIARPINWDNVITDWIGSSQGDPIEGES